MPKKITPIEQAKPTRDEVEAEIKSGFKRLMGRKANPVYQAFFAELEASKGRTCLDELAFKELVVIETVIKPDTDHPDGIHALECCALAREAKTEKKANYWLRKALASWKDWMLWDQSEIGRKHSAKQSEIASKTRTFPSDDANRRIAEAYWEIKGQKGKVKALAAAKNLTTQQIRNIAENERKKRELQSSQDALR